MIFAELTYEQIQKLKLHKNYSRTSIRSLYDLMKSFLDEVLSFTTNETYGSIYKCYNVVQHLMIDNIQ